MREAMDFKLGHHPSSSSAHTRMTIVQIAIRFA
jgi:hypothetical protein